METTVYASGMSNTCVVKEERDVQLTTEVATTREELDRVAGDWNELLCRSKADTLFLTWEWISTWLDTVYSDAPLFVVLVYDQDRQLVGVGPFYFSSMRALKVLPLKCLRVLGDSQCGAEYSDLIILEGREESVTNAIASCLADARRQWDCLWVPSVAGWTGGRERWTALFEGLSADQSWRGTDGCAVKLPATYEAYLGGLRPRIRQDARRQVRKVESLGTVDLQICRDEEEVREALDLLYDIHHRRWRRRGQEGSFVRRARLVEFNNRFAPVSFSRGWLRLYTLRVVGEPVACLLAHAYNGIAHGLQIAFDPDIDGAGRVLMNEALRALIAEGIVEYDFLGGGQKYKRDLGGESRQGYQTFAAGRSFRSRLVSGPGLWPTGRFMTQGPPESFGSSHD